MNYAAAKQYVIQLLSEKLNPQLTYHGLHHTLDVLHITRSLCEKENIGAHDTLLLKTAALFHDTGFTVSNMGHEQHGCDIVREQLPTFGFKDEDIEKICGMIMATKIPQTPLTHLEEIICDADLDYLGRDDFYSIGETLFVELKHFNVLQKVEDWNRIQVKFLEAHHFFTRTNIDTRNPIKQQHLQRLKDLVATY